MLAPEGRPRFEVADVVRAHGDDHRRAHHPSAAQEAVLKHIADCRTAALGGHLEACDSCGHQRISYNSCRDRHCPKCQNTARAKWITERLERLLPIPYFHVVFTIPAELNPLALRNKQAVFNILFAAASRTLLTLARDEKHLGAQVGFTAVLHTWGQNLLFHPHLHCVVTGGGLSADDARWVCAREKYLLPVEVLGKLFRGKFLAALDRAFQNGDLDLGGSTAELSDPATWRRFKDGLYNKDWVVYAKAPFGGPEHVFRYLGNYTHRIAISNHRLLEVRDARVRFRYKDYAHGPLMKEMSLSATEFIRRFLLHVLPSGFMRVRHYGLLANRHREDKLARCRELLGCAAPPPLEPGVKESLQQSIKRLTGVDILRCPWCGGGPMRLIERLSAMPPDTS